MKRYLIIIIVAIAAVLIFLPEVREWVFNLGKSAVDEMEIVEKPGSGRKSSRREQVRVYHLRRDEDYYHRRDCPTFAEDDVPVRIAILKARGLFKPCPVCRPPR